MGECEKPSLPISDLTVNESPSRDDWLYAPLSTLLGVDDRRILISKILALIQAGDIPDLPLYFLLAGRLGGQTATGGTDPADDLTLSSTANATKGNIAFGTSGKTFYDETNDQHNINSIQFDLTPTGAAAAEGKLIWNADDGTLTIGLPGGKVVLRIGQAMVLPRRVRNDSGVDMKRGNLVWISGVQGQRAIVSLAKADTEATSRSTIAMLAEDINDGAQGYALTAGIAIGTAAEPIDTSTFARGDPLWLSAATGGEFVKVKPISPNHAVSIGIVWKVHATEGEVYLKIQNGWELYELHDVSDSLVSPTAGELLAWNAATTLWEQAANLVFDFVTGQLAATSFAGDGSDLTGLEIADTDLAATSPILLTGNTLSHAATNGNVHVPADGASAQILQFSNAGIAKWITASGDATIADNGEMTVADDSHAHTGSTLSDIDASDTNITVSSPIVLTVNDFSFDFSTNNIWTGTFKHRNASDSTTAFQILDAGGTPIFNADTVNGRTGHGTISPTAKLEVVPKSSEPGIRVKGAVEQAEALIELLNSSDNVFMTSGNGLAESEYIINAGGIDVDCIVKGIGLNLIHTSAGLGATSIGGAPLINVMLRVYEPAKAAKLLIESGTGFAAIDVKGGQVGDVDWALMSGFPNAGDFTIRESGVANYLTIKKTTGFTGIGDPDADTRLEVAGAITIQELSTDPADPEEGKAVLWKSDGTGTGADGDLLYMEKSGGAVATGSLKWADFSPSSITVNTGTVTGGTGVADAQVMFDGNALTIDEVAATPGFDVEFVFSGIDRNPSLVVCRWIYNGSATHHVTIDIWNYNTAAWDDILVFVGSGGHHASMTMYIPRASNGNYVSGGAAKVRMYHHEAGNASHDIAIDYVGLTHALQGVL